MNRTKRKIFMIAMKLFSQKGYDNTSIEEITAVAGIAKGSLYYHFSKKEDIFDLLLEEGMKLLKNSIEIKTKNATTALEKLKAIALIHIKVVTKYEDLTNVLLSHLYGKESKNIKCQKTISEYIDILKAVIEEGIANGEFINVNPEIMATSVFGVINSIVIYKMRNKLELEQYYESFVDIIESKLIK